MHSYILLALCSGYVRYAALVVREHIFNAYLMSVAEPHPCG